MHYVLEDIVNGYLKLTADNIDAYYDCIKEEFADSTNFVEYISVIEDCDNKMSMIERFVQRESVVSIPQSARKSSQNQKSNDTFTTNLATLLNSLSSLPVEPEDPKLGSFLTRLCCEYGVFNYFATGSQAPSTIPTMSSNQWEQLYKKTTTHIPPEIARQLKTSRHVPKMTRGN